MNRKRNTSYKHCYNLILKILEFQEVKNVNINIVNNTDKKLELEITIDDKYKRLIYDKKLKTEKKIINSASYNNLKNSKKVLSDGKHNEKNKNSIDININEIVNKHLHENVIYDIIKNIKNKIILNNSINEEISSEVISSNETILENKNIISQNNDELKSDSDIYEEDDDSIIDLPEPCDDCDETRRICNENYEVAMKYKEDLEKEQKVNNFLLKEINYKFKIIEELKSKINKKDENLKGFVDWANETIENKKTLIKINKNLFNLFSEIIDINGKYLDNNNKFIKYLDKKLNNASLRLIYNEKIKTQNILNGIMERFDTIQDDIEKELNEFQDLLMKKD